MKQKTFKMMLAIVFVAVLLTGCSSTTVIQSVPNGAKVKVNGESIGVTPVKYSDSKISFSESEILLELEGYEPYRTWLTRDEKVNVGAVVGGCFFWAPFLWALEYKPEHTYELVPLRPEFQPEILPETGKDSSGGLTPAQIAKLRELKKLLDDGILTQEEFNMEKKKILEGTK